MARVVAVPVAYPLLDHLLQRPVVCGEFSGGCMLNVGGPGAVRGQSIYLDGVWKGRNLAQLPETLPKGVWGSGLD